MRSRQLQAALTDFVEQSAARLHADVLAGHEVPFELAARSRRGRGTAAMYCYQPLTGAFVADRFTELRRLAGHAPAAELLASFDGLDRYLASWDLDLGRRSPAARADAALLALLRDVFGEQTDFDVHPERLKLALGRLDGAALAGAAEVTLVATLHGVTIASQELRLTRGLMLARPHALEGAPEEIEHAFAEGSHAEEHLLVVFTAQEPDPRNALTEGREVVRDLLRALRLFGDGRVTLGPLAWTRVASGPWSPLALGLGGRPHGMLVIGGDQEDELRAFCSLVSRRAPHGNEIAWALERFEMGCERAGEYEGLSDYLLALRALLGEPDGVSDGLLAGRLAALCAKPELRAALTERTLGAIALERSAIAGKAVERASGVALVRDLADNLRALLSDAICGHLPSSLIGLADTLLLSGEELSEQVSSESSQAGEILHLAV